MQRGAMGVMDGQDKLGELAEAVREEMAAVDLRTAPPEALEHLVVPEIPVDFGVDMAAEAKPAK